MCEHSAACVGVCDTPDLVVEEWVRSSVFLLQLLDP